MTRHSKLHHHKDINQLKRQYASLSKRLDELSQYTKEKQVDKKISELEQRLSKLENIVNKRNDSIMKFLFPMIVWGLLNSITHINDTSINKTDIFMYLATGIIAYLFTINYKNINLVSISNGILLIGLSMPFFMETYFVLIHSKTISAVIPSSYLTITMACSLFIAPTIVLFIYMVENVFLKTILCRNILITMSYLVITSGTLVCFFSKKIIPITLTKNTIFIIFVALIFPLSGYAIKCYFSKSYDKQYTEKILQFKDEDNSVETKFKKLKKIKKYKDKSFDDFQTKESILSEIQTLTCFKKRIRFNIKLAKIYVSAHTISRDDIESKIKSGDFGNLGYYAPFDRPLNENEIAYIILKIKKHRN